MSADVDDNPYAPEPDSWHEGWHYTSWSNWLKIRQEGLKPTLLSPDKIAALDGLVASDWDCKAVWVWTQKLSPIEHMGSVIYQLAQRSETRIVMLKLRYQFKQRLAPLPESGGTQIRLYHNGNVGRFKYHHRTRSCLLIEVVPPTNITFMGEYDVLELLGAP